MSTVRFYTFEEWKEKNKDLEEDAKECDLCDGSGLHTCGCGNKHKCGDCDGKGKLINLYEIYIATRNKEKRLLGVKP